MKRLILLALLCALARAGYVGDIWARRGWAMTWDTLSNATPYDTVAGDSWRWAPWWAVMAYTDSSLATVSDIVEARAWIGTDSVCVLSETPYVAGGVLVVLNGVAQTPATDYTVSNDTVTFTFKPDSGDVSLSFYQYGDPGVAGIDTIEIETWLGADSVVTLAGRPINTAVLVTLNGVVQAPISDFVVDGDSVVLTAKPESTDVSLVRYQGR